MADNVFNENIEELISDTGNISNNLENIINAIDCDDIDSRVTNYFESFKKLGTEKNNLNNIKDNVNSYKIWLSDTYKTYLGTDSAVKQLANDAAANTFSGDSSFDGSSVGGGAASAIGLSGLSDGLDSITGGLGSASNLEQYILSAEDWANLSGQEKDAIINKLKELGFTDEEINNIKDGKVSVDKAKLELLSSELEELYKKDPSIRQKLIDLYGFDIFNDDGTINKEKLALTMLMDDKNKDDKYDLSLLINKLKASSSKSLSGLETSVGNISKVNTAKISSNVGKTAVAGGTVAGAIGGISSLGKATSKGDYGTDAQALETESNKTELTKQEDSDDSLINTGLEKEASKLIKKIKPTTSGDIKKQGGAAMVAAGLAATGAIGGGGAVIVKKTMMLKFTPEDWARQPQNIKDAVLADFKAVGFQPSQIELFEKSTLKIKAKLVDDVIFSIRKAQILDESIKEELNSTYKFSVFNEENKISRYLVLLVMLIDGKRVTDDVSIYNILNNILSDTNYSNYIYTGTTLEEIVVTEEEKKEAEERKQKEEENKITDKKENNKSTQMEEKDIKTQKEWLESIGILDNL